MDKVSLSSCPAKGGLFADPEFDMLVYLPAPLPKQRPAPRRSPRLQGIAPEHVAMTFESECPPRESVEAVFYSANEGD